MVWLQLPPEALNKRSPDNQTSNSPDLDDTGDSDPENVRVKFVLYDNAKFFRPQQSGGGQEYILSVVSASVGDAQVDNLTSPVSYYIGVPDGVQLERVSPKCVYWDETGMALSQHY